MIFAHDDDYRFYLECLQGAIEKNKLSIHSYVLMTNHVHLLVSPELETSISKALQSVGRRYVQYFNYTYKRTDTFYAVNAEGKTSELIQSHNIYRKLGENEEERQSAYRQLFLETIGKSDTDALREATNKGWVLGGDQFRTEIERLSGRRSIAKPRGRPKRIKG